MIKGTFHGAFVLRDKSRRYPHCTFRSGAIYRADLIFKPYL
jgi:hypothetical protein